MQSSLIVPLEWIDRIRDVDAEQSSGECVESSANINRVFTRDDYAQFSVFNHSSGVIFSALPSLEFMSTRVKIWMPTLLDVLGHCDIDPALYPAILHISESDWLAWQQGKLDTVSIETALCSRLLWEILSFFYCLVGSWDHVSGLLNTEARLQRLNNRAPLHMIKSGDIRALANLHHFLAGEVLGSPFS